MKRVHFLLSGLALLAITSTASLALVGVNSASLHAEENLKSYAVELKTADISEGGYHTVNTATSKMTFHEGETGSTYCNTKPFKKITSVNVKGSSYEVSIGLSEDYDGLDEATLHSFSNTYTIGFHGGDGTRPAYDDPDPSRYFVIQVLSGSLSSITVHYSC